MDSNGCTIDHRLPLAGRSLRFVLVDQIRRRGTTTVGEMVAALGEAGYNIAGRASKVISDALRWEMARGRISRVARGIYRYRSAPQSTARRIRIFADTCHAWISAVMHGEQPAPTPPDHRAYSWRPPEDPLRPPWTDTHWVWTM